MSKIVLAIAVLGVLAVAAGVVHLILTYADRRGWVYYRNPDRQPPRSLGLLEEIYQPSITHVIEEAVSTESRADVSESGDPEAPEPRQRSFSDPESEEDASP
jgi:hypothetical protein